MKKEGCVAEKNAFSVYFLIADGWIFGSRCSKRPWLQAIPFHLACVIQPMEFGKTPLRHCGAGFRAVLGLYIFFCFGMTLYYVLSVYTLIPQVMLRSEHLEGNVEYFPRRPKHEISQCIMELK